MATKTASKKTSSRKSAASSKTTKSQKTSKTAGSAQSQKAAIQEAFAPVLKRAKSTGWLAIIESLIIGVLGAILIIDPEGILKVIFYVVGIFLIVKGVYHIVNYFAIHGKYDFYNNDLLYGIVALVFGVVCVVLWEQLGKAVGIVVGAWMIYGALVRLNTAIKLHAAGVKEWFYVLLLSLVMLALGIYMIISTAAVPQIVGWLMIAGAFVGIIDDAIFIRNINQLSK